MFNKRLLNTVAIPVLSVAVLAKPVAAAVTGHPERQTQSRQAEEQLIQLAQAVTCNDGSEAPDADTCAARDAQAAAEEEARRQAEAEAQAAAEAEAQRQAEAEAQAAAEAEAQRQAEAEAQAAAEAEAQRQAEAEAQAAAEAEAQRQAEAEAQAAAEAEAQRAAEAEAEAQRAAEAEAQQQAEAEAQRAAEAEAEAQRAAEAEAQRAAEEAQQAEPAVEEQPATVTCADGSQAASEAECATPAQPEEQPVDEQPAQTEEQPAEEVQPTPDSAAPEQTEELPTEEQATGEEVPAEAQPEGEQVLVPAVEPTENQPVPQITDTRTAEEKEAIAEDPSQTSETVVLPVDNGAAVLDSDKDADNSGGENVRQRRSELRAQEDVAPAPETDADAQSEAVAFDPQTLQATVSEQGTTMDAAPTFEVPTTVTNVTNSTVTNNVTSNVTNNNVTNNTVIQNNVVNQVTEVRVIEQIDNRTVINVGNQIVVRGDDRRRLGYDAQQTYYEQLSRGRTRETIERADGSKLVTVYNRYGDIIIRSRISPGGREYVLMYSPEADGQRPAMYVDVGLSLPPMRLTIPVDDYIVSTTRSPDRDYYDFLARPPVERVERVYSIDEVKSSARIRDKVRRIDLDTITFPSGSAEVPLEQARTLRRVAQAMEKLLENDPGEVFLIEGHTDAVGSDRSNLILSDKRAETVANLLTEVYGIPPENMSVQGYGERFLKIRTEAAEQQNRRVAIRRVTTLVRPANVSSNN
ncbi:hypothetical protein D4A92_18685 [Rhizobium rosettiformans]|uniref:OmpA-like domain-containing protein n=1 Tax=Rhizobium rosettiformans TaxID=1368430 RepID=A0ABX7F0W6_9HYPH|nr:OmpA family protein [Rhizobium rosettiformans]QRF53327.1 hypothetical protein D4A92_18685 [Rhizobium rosettiformans]